MANKSEIIKSKSGATSRSKAIPYDLVPREAIIAIANRYQYGRDHGHAKNNWKIAKDDPEYQQERVNHAFEHFLRIQDGTGTREDLEAVLCNLAMLCWWLDNGSGAKESFPHLYERKDK